MSESTVMVDSDSETGAGSTAPSGTALPRLVQDIAAIPDDELDQVRAAHVRFKVTGAISGPGLSSIEGLTPIHLYPLLRFERIRGDYPAVLSEDGAPPVPLTSIIDNLIDESEAEGDDLEYFRRSVLRLESEMRVLADAEGERELAVLWNAALEQLEARLSPDEHETVIGHLQQARSMLNTNGQVVPFGRDTAFALLKRTSTRIMTQRTGRLMDELEQLGAKMRALLEVDRSERPDAHAPDALEESVGEAFSREFNFDALSDLIEKAPHGPTLAKDRRARIESILEVISGQQAAMRRLATDLEITTISSAGELIGRADDHRSRCLDLAKAVQKARLEASDQYDEEHHGPQFEAFGTQSLSTADLFSLPVVPVVVDAEQIDEFEPTLQTLLDASEPIKVLLMVDTVVGNGRSAAIATPVGLRMLAGGRPSAALFQVSLSDLQGTTAAFEKALAHEGPAVVCLYDGSGFGGDALHPYLRAAAARDGRLFAAFENDPESGAKWAERFTVNRNTAAEADWPVSEITYLDGAGSETTETWPFTAAEVMATDARFLDGFRQIEPEHWHADLVPLHEFLLLDRRETHVPFILMVTPDGVLVRVICSDRIVRAVEQVRNRWRALQELGGIQNSHAIRLLEVEQQQMEDETRRRIDEAEAAVRAELEQKTGVLAERIISNIASGLLGSDLTQAPAGLTPSVTASPAPDKIPSSGAEVTESLPAEEDVIDAGEAVEAEEEEEFSFDEAYIETPRCTTCDECTTINPRMFAYNESKQAYIVDPAAGTFREMVEAAEKCPVKIIHPGKPLNPDEPHLDELAARAEPFQ